MTQMVLPIFPEGTTMITPVLGFEKREGQVYYFHGGIPVFSHAEEDIRSFKMFVSQLVVNGNCKQADIVRAFGIPSITMKRAVKLYREKGPPGFFEKRKIVRKPRVMTPGVLEKAQSLLDEGKDRFEVARELGIKSDTFYRAIRSGKLVERPLDEKKTKAGEA
jgi:transposase-like protein